MALKKRLRKLIPYWLSGHEEQCAGCGRRHSSASTAHCAACDRPQCLVCAIHEGDEVFCSECREEGGRRRWRRARSGKA